MCALEDPRPLPPRVPEPGECCKQGCEPCVFDRYDEAFGRYQTALKAWLVRHPESRPDSLVPGVRKTI